MNSDFRVNTGVFNHIKIKRLIGRHGVESFIGLQKLWAYTATTESEDGLFLGFNSADISIIAEINDDQFAENLVKIRLLDKLENGYAIHNWRRHNPWCCESKNRSESARIAAQTRWDKVRKSSGNKNDK